MSDGRLSLPLKPSFQIVSVLRAHCFSPKDLHSCNSTFRKQISFSSALGLFIESECEFFDFCIFDDIKETDIKNLLLDNPEFT